MALRKTPEHHIQQGWYDEVCGIVCEEASAHVEHVESRSQDDDSPKAPVRDPPSPRLSHPRTSLEACLGSVELVFIRFPNKIPTRLYLPNKTPQPLR